MRVAQIQDEDYKLITTNREAPALPKGGALLRLIGCGLCGSDLDKIMNRKAPGGAVLGHEVVGEIIALDAGVSAFQIGDRIVTSHHTPCGDCHYCLNDSESMCAAFKASNLQPGGFSEVIALTAEHLAKTVFKVPADVTDIDASCVEPLACVLRAIRRSLRNGPNHSPSALIIGLGFIGAMAAQVYQQQGFTVSGIDLVDSRIELAKSHGWLSNATHDKVDIVFLTVVTAATIDIALTRVRDGGTIVLFTSAQKAIALDPSALYFREINVVTSYSPALIDLQAAADLIFHHRLTLAPLVTHTVSLDNIEEAVNLYQRGEAMKVFVTL